MPAPPCPASGSTLGTALLVAASLPALCPAAAEIELSNGDTIDATLLDERPAGGDPTQGQVTLEHPSLGTLTVPATALARKEAEPEAEGGTVKMANQVGEIIDSILFPGWEKSIAAGFNGRNANTETLSIYANFSTSFENESRSWDINADYFRSTTDDETTESNLIIRADRDWLLPGKKHFYFARGTAEYDQFESFEQRFGLYGGIGAELLKSGKHELSGRIGAGALYEFGGNEDFNVELLLGLNYTYQISENQSFELRNTLFPAVDPLFGEYRNVTEANYAVQLAAGDGLSLKLGVYNEFESEVDAGLDENDFRYFGALVYDF